MGIHSDTLDKLHGEKSRAIFLRDRSDAGVSYLYIQASGYYNIAS